MTGVQTWNKGIAPAGSDGWNLTPDVRKAIETLNTPVPVANQAERDSLAPPSGRYAGMQVVRTDLSGCPTDTYNGSGWVLPPLGQIAVATYASAGTGDIAFNFLVIIADVTTPSLPAGRKLRITLETDGNMSANSGVCAVVIKQGGTTGNDDGSGLRNCGVAYQTATNTQSSDLTAHFTTTTAGPQRLYAISRSIAPSGATVNYPAGARRITIYDDGAA